MRLTEAGLVFLEEARRTLRQAEWTTFAAKRAAAGLTGLLRISFGILWIFDGILQAQSAMPLGLPSQVIQPAAAAITTPGRKKPMQGSPSGVNAIGPTHSADGGWPTSSG